MIVSFFAFLGFDLLFILLGILFLNGNGSFLIAGYNTASKTERAKYDEKELCKAMGKLMLALSVCWLIVALNFLFKSIAFLWIGLSLFVVVSVIGVVYINTSKKIKRK